MGLDSTRGVHGVQGGQTLKDLQLQKEGLQTELKSVKGDIRDAETERKGIQTINLQEQRFNSLGKIISDGEKKAKLLEAEIAELDNEIGPLKADADAKLSARVEVGLFMPILCRVFVWMPSAVKSCGRHDLRSWKRSWDVFCRPWTPIS